jgi:hypothetical protein
LRSLGAQNLEFSIYAVRETSKKDRHEEKLPASKRGRGCLTVTEDDHRPTLRVDANAGPCWGDQKYLRSKTRPSFFTRSRVNSIITVLEHVDCRIDIATFTASMVDSKVRTVLHSPIIHEADAFLEAQARFGSHPPDKSTRQSKQEEQIRTSRCPGH